MHSEIRYLTAGDSGIVVEFGSEISPATSAAVRSFADALQRANLPGVVSYNPTYRSVLVEYNPLVSSYKEMLAGLRHCAGDMGETAAVPLKIFHMPVLYGGEYGPDLPLVAENAGMSEKDVVEIHSAVDYPIYMIGFAPAFPYLGGMDSRIETPRLETPRAKIPAGSVGIAGMQTGVYPLQSPGGWQLIGRTPVPLYDPARTPPILYRTGDIIRFEPIDKTAYRRIEEEIAADKYIYRYSEKEGGQ